MKKHIKYIVSLTIFFIFLNIFIHYNNFFEISISTGKSMSPTIKENTIDIFYKSFSEINKNDIYSIYNPAYGQIDVKRVIGTEGDILQIKNNKLYINGKLDINEFSQTADYSQYEGLYEKIEKDEYYVMGDNRNASTDSRDYGCISKNEFLSKWLFSIY